MSLSKCIYQQSVMGEYTFPIAGDVLAELEESNYIPVERRDHRVVEDFRRENMPEGHDFAILWQTLHFRGDGVHTLWTADKDDSRPLVDLGEAYKVVPQWWPVQQWDEVAARIESAHVRESLDKLRAGA